MARAHAYITFYACKYTRPTKEWYVAWPHRSPPRRPKLRNRVTPPPLGKRWPLAASPVRPRVLPSSLCLA